MLAPVAELPRGLVQGGGRLPGGQARVTVRDAGHALVDVIGDPGSQPVADAPLGGDDMRAAGRSGSPAPAWLSAPTALRPAWMAAVTSSPHRYRSNRARRAMLSAAQCLAGTWRAGPRAATAARAAATAASRSAAVPVCA